METHSARLFAEKASPAERTEILGMAAWLDKGYGRASKGRLNAEEVFELHQRHMRDEAHGAPFAHDILKHLQNLIERSSVVIGV